MTAKIFYRERRKVKDGEKKPRYRIVAVLDVNLKVYTDHLRRSEMEHLAKEVSADLVALPLGSKKDKK